MKNFLQFIIPITIIFIIGGIFFLSERPVDDTKMLHIKCNNNYQSYEVFSSTSFIFSPKDDICKLDIEVSNVEKDYVKINTKYLWSLKENGELDKSEPKTGNIISLNKETILFSFDEKTKYIFEYK